MRFLARVMILTSAALILVSRAYAVDVVIHDGSKVSFDYVLTVDNKVMDSSQTRGPLEYTQGETVLLPSLTKQMAGMKVGDEKIIVLKPEEAYGNPDPSGIKEVPSSSIPPEVKPQVGMILQMQDKAGQTFPAKVIELKKDSIVIDLNHPLAGKTLNFKVRIVSIK